MMIQAIAEGSARCGAGVRERQFVRAGEEKELLALCSYAHQKRQVRMQGTHQAGMHEGGCFDSRIA